MTSRSKKYTGFIHETTYTPEQDFMILHGAGAAVAKALGKTPQAIRARRHRLRNPGAEAVHTSEGVRMVLTNWQVLANGSRVRELRGM